MLHQIWIGPLDPPDGLFDTWRVNHPGWAHRVWTETDLDDPNVLPWRPSARALYEAYVRQRYFPGAADVARVEILKTHGGVYLDADTECLHPLDGAAFLDAGFFVSESPHRPGGTQNAVLGSLPGHPVIEAYSAAFDSVTRLRPAWEHVGSGLLETVLASLNGQTADVALIPSPAFHPRRANGAANPAGTGYTGPVYADHRFGTTSRYNRVAQIRRRTPLPRRKYSKEEWS